MSKIEVVELTEVNFRPFGQIISQSSKEVACDDANITYTKQIYTSEMGEISTSIMSCKKRAPLLHTMEKHEDTPEIMVNLGGDAVLVLAEKDYDFKSGITEKIKAFRIKKGDSYVIHPAIWHWASYPLKEETVDYLVIFKYDTENTDIVNENLVEVLEINIVKE